jgi:TonB-linked SusC/RagA family outer membrane protein
MRVNLLQNIPSWLISRICVAMLLYGITAQALSARAYSQTIDIEKLIIDIELKNASLSEAFRVLESKTKLTFGYDEKIARSIVKINLVAKQKSVASILNQICTQGNLEYRQVENAIDFRQKQKIKSSAGLDEPQQRVITGTVTSNENEPIPGINILIKGTATGTATNADGVYSILAETGDVLVFSFIGFARQEITVDERSVIDVVLTPDIQSLEEVVVVAYGVQKKMTSIGAQSSVKAAELKQPVANLSNTLAGKIAGIVGVQRSGEPGYDNAELYIRGISSFVSSGSSPLILIDGVERSFNNLDPEDIESFSILKDASATAVYGVRGGNGVILIQTKKGKVSRPQISIQYNQGITQFTRLPELADGVTYMNIANEARRNSNPALPPIYTAERIEATSNGSDPDLYPNVDWFKEIFNETGENKRFNFNVNGGSEKATYYLSLAYYNEKGLFKNESLRRYASGIGFNRFNFTSNLSLDLTRSTKVDFGASGYLSQGNYPGSSTGSIFQAAYLLPPVVHPLKYSDGKIAQQRSGDIFNPYALLAESGYVTETRGQVWSNIRVTQRLDKLTQGLSATAMYSFDNNSTYRLARTKSVDRWYATGRDEAGNLVYEGDAPVHVGSSVLGYSRENGGTNQSYLEAAVNYNRVFNKSDVSGMLLYNQVSRLNAFANDFTSSIPYRFHGVAGRVTYAYDERYMLEANFGYNGSEAFAPSSRYGFFPSIGLGWIASKEKFFAPLEKYVQFLKIRVSHGTVGNAVISSGQRFAYLSTVSGAGGYSFGRSQDRNYDGLDMEYYAANVQWETSKKSNIGVEVGVLQDALSINIDFFKNVRTGIYLQRGDMPEYAGVRNNPTGNLGEIYNRGIDGTLDFKQNIGNHFQAGFRANVTWTRSTVINDANAEWPYPWQQRIGRKLGQRFGYTALGLFESEEEIANSPRQTGTVKPGDIRYKDLNSDGVINGYDMGPIGYGSFPEMVYGFGPTFTYKGWALGAFFKGISRVDIMLNGEGLVPFSQGVGTRGNLLSVITDRWTEENPNPNAFYPRLSDGVNNMNYAESTWWVRDGSYIRLQNVELSYTFPRRNWFNKIGLGNLRLYFLSYNTLTWSKFKLWDVELGDGRGGAYPLIRTYSMGIDCKF